ncbi:MULTISPECIES: hypothetical protein [Sorangium]|uniref:Uncharacterized protein n=1 Tax=Sorangium cellulosum TaxID=56 RepID=A0A4P2QQ83_SORCE|nr:MULTISPECIES: hypothetical protein [Sorangium]AUX32128.1 hypothetical protein SOCE836_042640 [Sorangium cellulosum]WCQ91498.1 hypothetical protein NQZ70_04220 [Sorangium sp. Soce836]
MRSTRRRWAVAALALLGGALWLVDRSREPDGRRPPSSRQEASQEETPREAASRRTTSEPPALAGSAQLAAAALDLAVIGPSPDDRHDGPAHPHPITPRHLEMQHENGLIALLNDAMSARNGARMRELVHEYRRTHPGDPSRLQDGYEIIAGCLEAPGEASRAAAEGYYAEHRASTVRRFVRAICLEGG